MLAQMQTIEARGYAAKLANEYRNLALCVKSLIDNNKEHADVLLLCTHDPTAAELLENCLHDAGALPALDCPALAPFWSPSRNANSRS